MVILIIGPKSLTKHAHNFHLTIYSSTLSASPHFWNLGVIFNSNLSFKHRINHITPTASFHLKNVAIADLH